MTLRWLKKRDGRRVPFDPRKLARSIQLAAEAAGERHAVLADELAEVVALFLAQSLPNRIPDAAELSDVVEKVLLETNHARTAAVYAERIKMRSRKRGEVVVVRDEELPLAADGEPLPEPPGEPWNEGRIAAALERRCALRPELAEEVASAVEQKIFALGFKRVKASLIREIVNGELAERGFSARIGRRADIAVHAAEVRRLLVAGYLGPDSGADAAPGGAEAAVGVDLLTRFVLSEVYPAAVSEAHLDGTIHIQDLGRPLRLTSGAISIAALAVRLGRDLSRQAGSLGLEIARLARRAAPFHARALAVPFANVFLAPFVQGREAGIRRDLCEFVRLLPAGLERPRFLVHLAPVPDSLAALPAIGPGGRRWRATYGDLRAEADRCARLLLEVAAAEAERGPVARFVVAAADEAAIRLAGERADLSLELSGLVPQASRGLAAAAALAEAAEAAAPLLPAGAAQVVALNCARAAYRAGPGDERTFQRELDQALGLALAAIEAKWAFLETALYRPRLPLWEASGRGEERAVAAAASLTHAIAPIGLAEAVAVVARASPACDEAAARLLAELALRMEEKARAEGVRMGLRLRLEEPEAGRAARRLTDLDLTRFAAARELLKLEAGATDLGYSCGFGACPSLRELLYRPLGLAPFIERGKSAPARAAAFLAAAAVPSVAFVGGAPADGMAPQADRSAPGGVQAPPRDTPSEMHAPAE